MNDISNGFCYKIQVNFNFLFQNLCVCQTFVVILQRKM